MINQELKNYIKEQRSLGVDDQSIRQALLDVGWGEEVVDRFLTNDTSSSVKEDKASMDKFLKASTLLSKAFKLYKKKFLQILLILALPVVFSISLLFTPNIFSKSFILDRPEFPLLIIIIFVFLLLLKLIFNILSLLALILLLSEKENKSVWGYYKLAVKRFWRYIWLSLIMYFVLFGGMIIFMIPGIMFGFIFLIAPIVFVVEKINGMSVLVKAGKYIKGNSLDYFLKNIFGAIVVGVVYLIVWMIMQPINIFVSNTELFKNIIDILLRQFVIFPMFLIYLFLIYSNLKFLKPDIAKMTVVKRQKRIYLGFGIVGFIVVALIAWSFISIIILNRDLFFEGRNLIQSGKFLGL